MLKLNLGSNTQKIKGFTNVDHRQVEGVDIVDNVFTLDKLKNQCADEIIAKHILEHVPFDILPQVLKRWFDILAPNGIINIEVPSIDKVHAMFKDGKNKRIAGNKVDWLWLNSRLFGNASILRDMYGNKDYVTDFHKSIFNFEMLEDLLLDVGFINFKRLKTLPHHGILHATTIAVSATKPNDGV